MRSWTIGNLFVAASHAAATLQLTGTTTSLGGIAYWIPPDPVASLQLEHVVVANISSAPYTPVSVMVTTDASSASSVNATIDAALKRCQASDDVWTPEFSSVILLQNITQDDQQQQENNNASVQTTNDRTVVIQSTTTARQAPEGPYFLTSQGQLHRAYRLYADTQGSFVESVYASPVDGSYSVVPANVPGGGLAIAVPSRLYYTKTAEKPLAGVRLGVKDIFDVAGVKTGASSRAWYDLYPEANATAPAVQRLVDAGAIIIGKQKTAQFANGEYAQDWTDIHAPFNPRGDGYQDPNFSSAGAGAGLAAYDWLDLAITSDTGGSTRGPARVEGLYGLRPSHGLVSLDHVVPLAPEYDTAGLMVRDPVVLREAAAVLYSNIRNVSAWAAPPSTLLVEALPAGLSEESTAAVNAFLEDLRRSLNASASTPFNVTAAWETTAPQNKTNVPLSELLNTTYITVISQRQTKLVRDPFYADYAAKHPGRTPFVNPVPLVRWAFGDPLPDTAVDEALANSTVFREWWGNSVLAADDVTCSSAVLAYVSPPAVTYRNSYRSPPSVPTGFSSQYYSVYGEGPDLVVPIGQTTYNSTVTHHAEELPVTVNLMVAKGCDLALLSHVVEMTHSGLLRTSVVGASIIDGGDILLR